MCTKYKCAYLALSACFKQHASEGHDDGAKFPIVRMQDGGVGAAEAETYVQVESIFIKYIQLPFHNIYALF